MKYEKETEKAISLVKEAGKEAMKIYSGRCEIETKEDESPLTNADKTSHNILVDGLSEFGYGIVSEEAENINPKERMQWIIDPLDGTMDFIQKTGEFSIMVALVDNGLPVVGIVYAPALNKLWYAVKGEGAYLIHKDVEKRINVSGIEAVDEYRLVISRNHFKQNDKDVADRLGISRFKKMGSVGVKFCAIAEGKAELCVYTTSKMGVWDDCASHVILKEAGGEVFDIYGNEPTYNLKTRRMENGFIGTTGKNKNKILESIRQGL